ncbi:hypothetical protein OJ253_2522 [Cryptosporidium canis]|uniref:Uncharacterized protein n=1 Tax=Cryptosporidium canis TaxID=195482 RepID=A0A9D5HV15_9CRYT|nr:hypothetical protein OJ253_2522 [Cryptosporidium canis]
MWFPLKIKSAGLVVVFFLNAIFLNINVGFLSGSGGGIGGLVEASESSSSPSMTRLDAARRRNHPETANLPRYPVPGTRYAELSDSESIHGHEQSEKRRRKKKKSRKAKKSGEGSAQVAEEGARSSGGSDKDSKGSKSGASGGASRQKSSGKQKLSSSGSDSSSGGRVGVLDKSKLVMSEYVSYVPGVKDMIWQDASTRKTYKHLNSQYGSYFPKIATKPYRKSCECSSLFSSAKKAYQSGEIRTAGCSGTVCDHSRLVSDAEDISASILWDENEDAVPEYHCGRVAKRYLAGKAPGRFWRHQGGHVRPGAASPDPKAQSRHQVQADVGHRDL